MHQKRSPRCQGGWSRAPGLASIFILMCGLVMGPPGCKSTYWQAEFFQPEEFVDAQSSAPFVKCHMADGSLIVLEDWQLHEEDGLLQGSGKVFNAERSMVSEGSGLAVDMNRVTLIETNQPHQFVSGYMVVLGVMAGASLLMTALCLTNPKACFGSCPTFYAPDGDGWRLVAEGFSRSVARVLEERDVDALLALTSPHGGTLELVMANEALETHMVRTVRLLVAPRGADHHVYRAGESFFEVGNHAPPVNCSSAGGKCAELVAALDGQEYLSSADGENLATREVLELSFESPGGQPGLVIVARNSLMNTFLFYQGLAYMGRKAGEWTARLERGEEWIRRAIVGMDQLLGRINVSVLQPDGSWQSAGFFDEVGPLAREGQLIQLPGEVQQGDSIHIRLDMTQGYWRVDHLAVVPMLSQVVPQPVEIDTVLRDGKPDREARRRLLDPELHLMTMPGDAYTLQFKIPPGPADYLLESTGFYYEWIREQWLEEEDPIAAMRFLLDPEGTLRRLAPRYQEVEDEMEEIFWNSRVGVNL